MGTVVVDHQVAVRELPEPDANRKQHAKHLPLGDLKQHVIHMQHVHRMAFVIP